MQFGGAVDLLHQPSDQAHPMPLVPGRLDESGPIITYGENRLVSVTTPETFLGTVIGDINSRRGQIQAQEERHGDMVINALVPLSEMFGYVGDLRSKTSGQASYSMEFDSYAEVPQGIAEEIVKKVRGE